MDVHTVDHHLPAPPLGAVDQLEVAFLVGDLLRTRGAEGVRAGAEQFDAHRIGDLAHRGQRARKVLLRLGHRGADARYELHGVEQQFLLDVGMLFIVLEFGMVGADAAQHLTGSRYQFAALPVDQRQFPFDAER